MWSVWLGYAGVGRRRSAPVHRVRGVSRAKIIAADEGEREAEPDATLPDPDTLIARDEAESRRYAMYDPHALSDDHRSCLPTSHGLMSLDPPSGCETGDPFGRKRRKSSYAVMPASAAPSPGCSTFPRR